MALFGTDGIRGVYGRDLTNDVAYKLGGGLVELSTSDSPIIVIGADTRESGVELLSALVEGIIFKGGNPVNIGILPTAAVSYFTRVTGAQFGVVVSASHNPPEYNGLKVFDTTGVKLCKQKEKELNKIIERENVYVQPMTSFPVIKNAKELYVRNLLRKAPDLKGLSIALDCGHGAACGVAKEIFEGAGAEVLCINDTPDGAKINVECGATDTRNLEGVTKRGKYRLGFAFDGDADRLAVAENGYPVNTDSVYYTLAKYLFLHGYIGNKIVGTTISNMGLEESLVQIGMKMFRSDVGDREVYTLMQSEGAQFGGENSGHYILNAYGSAADGIANALLLAGIYKDVGSIAKYSETLRLKPSVLLNVDNLLSDEERESISESVKEKYGDCRIVIRKSGTEPILRILVESGSCDRAAEVAGEIAQLCGGKE